MSTFTFAPSAPWRWIKELDRVLRGDATRLSTLRDGALRIPTGGLSVVLVALAATYGFCAGWYALFNHTAGGWKQMLASIVKMPLLFALTLLVTFPSLYVFNALVGSRLSLASVAKLMVAFNAVMLSVLASLGPIVAFFSVTTTSYHFISLLNVAVCAVSGFLGVIFLLRTLHRLQVAAQIADLNEASELPAVGAGGEGSAAAAPFIPPGPLERLRSHVVSAPVKLVFMCWMVLFAIVGGQMSWVLRPFIGDPSKPFTLLRPRQSNFLEAVLDSLVKLFHG